MTGAKPGNEASVVARAKKLLQDLKVTIKDFRDCSEPLNELETSHQDCAASNLQAVVYE